MGDINTKIPQQFTLLFESSKKQKMNKHFVKKIVDWWKQIGGLMPQTKNKSIQTIGNPKTYILPLQMQPCQK